MNRLGDDDDIYVALVIVLAIAAMAIGLRLAGKYADRVARERVQLEIESGDYSAGSEGKEVRKFKTRAALALLLCVGCAEASPGDPGGAGGFVRTGQRVVDDGGSGDVRAPSDLALADLVPPAPDVGGDLATMTDAAPAADVQPCWHGAPEGPTCMALNGGDLDRKTTATWSFETLGTGCPGGPFLVGDADAACFLATGTYRVLGMDQLPIEGETRGNVPPPFRCSDHAPNSGYLRFYVPDCGLCAACGVKSGAP